MTILLILFFLSLTFGQLGGIPINSTTTVYAQDLVLPFLLIAGIWKLRGKHVRVTPLWVPIATFIAAGILSLLANMFRFPLGEIGQSSLYLVRWILYTSLYWVVVQDFVSPLFWMWGMYLSGMILAAFGFIQYIWYPYLRNLSYLGWDPHLYRVFSTLFDPNFLGLILVFTVFLGIYLWQRKKLRWFLGIGQILTGLAFFLTYSRSSYLAFIVALIIFLGFLKKWGFLIALLLLFLIGLLLLPKPGGEGVNLFRTVSTFARFGDWQRGIILIRDAPVFGYGFNTLRYVQRAKGWIDESQMISRAGAGLDNSFEFVWATTGVIGFGAYLWLLIRMYKLAAELKRGKERLFVYVYLALGGGMLIHGLFLNSLFYPWTVLWWWVLTGVAERFVRKT